MSLPSVDVHPEGRARLPGVRARRGRVGPAARTSPERPAAHQPPNRLSTASSTRGAMSPPAPITTLRPMFESIDHVGVAVEDLDAAMTLYSDTFGMPVQHRETVPSRAWRPCSWAWASHTSSCSRRSATIRRWQVPCQEGPRHPPHRLSLRRCRAGHRAVPVARSAADRRVPAARHPRQPGGLHPSRLHRRRADRAGPAGRGSALTGARRRRRPARRGRVLGRSGDLDARRRQGLRPAAPRVQDGRAGTRSRRWTAWSRSTSGRFSS